MKFKYLGGGRKQVNGKQIKIGDIVDMPDSFRHLLFEPVVEKKNRIKFNDLKINKKNKKIRRKKK